MGLIVSDAFRLLLIRVAKEKKLPFDPLIPNKETIAAMRAARAGKLITIGTLEDLKKDLKNEDD